MDPKPKDLAPGFETSLDTRPEETIVEIKEQINKSSLAREADKFPKGVQFIVEGPLVPVHPNVFTGQSLGVLNVEGAGTDNITLDYRSHSGGKDFVVRIGKKVEIDGAVDPKEVASLLLSLFARVNVHGHFIGDESQIRLGSMGNLEFYDKDGNPLPKHPSYKGSKIKASAPKTLR